MAKKKCNNPKPVYKEIPSEDERDFNLYHGIEHSEITVWNSGNSTIPDYCLADDSHEDLNVEFVTALLVLLKDLNSKKI